MRAGWARRRPAMHWTFRCSAPEVFVEAGEEAALGGAAGGRDEDRVVPRERADNIGPVGAVEHDRDALRRARRRADDRQAGAGGPPVAHEGGDRGEIVERRRGFAGQPVAVALLGDAELAQVATDAR